MSTVPPTSRGTARTGSTTNITVKVPTAQITEPDDTSITNGYLSSLSETLDVNVIDDDIYQTVTRLFSSRPPTNNLNPPTTPAGKKGERGLTDSIEDMVRGALQAERNHWKQRLHMSMQEIDRQHKVILTIQASLHEMVKSLQYSLPRNVILEEDDDHHEDMNNATIVFKHIETLKYQVRQLKLKAGVPIAASPDFEDTQIKQKKLISDLREKVKRMKIANETMETDLAQHCEKVAYLRKDNNSLHKQVQKLQKIVEKYNENHSGANFHLNNVNAPTPSTSLSTLEMESSGVIGGVGGRRERTYIEGDALNSYPTPQEESAIIKDRLRKNIYSVRKGDSRSSNVAQCLRCQTLFKPAENTHRSCRFHHKGREIKEHFDVNGKLEKVMYKWACCKKPLDTPGCCFGYHV